MSNAVKIIRAMAYNDKTVGPGMVFNDRLKDGRRSVKVWSWKKADYEKALAVLAAAGMKGELVKRPKPYEGYRVWVG